MATWSSARLNAAPKLVSIRPEPHSPDAERAVIASLLSDASTWDQVPDVTVEDFFCPENREAFRALTELHAESAYCDFNILIAYLERRGKLEEAGGRHYLGPLARDETVNAANVRGYADILLDRSRLRRLLKLNNQAVDEIAGGANAVDIIEGLRSELDRFAHEVTPPPDQTLEVYANRVVTFSPEALRTAPAPRKFVGPFPAGSGSVCAGAHAVGKSSILCEFSVHAALGRTFHGIELDPTDVLIVTKEDSAEDYHRKVYDLVAARDYPHADLEVIGRRLRILDLRGTSFRLLEQMYSTIQLSAEAHKIAQFIRDRFPQTGLIIFETSSRLGVGSENDNLAQALLMDAIELITRTTGAAGVLVHHLSKEAAREGRLDAYAMRGAGSLADNARAVLMIAARTSEMKDPPIPDSIAPEAIAAGRAVIVRHAKASYGPKMPDLWLIRERESSVLNRVIVAPRRSDDRLDRLVAYIDRVGSGRQPPNLTQRYLQAKCKDIGLSYREIAPLLEVGLSEHRLTSVSTHQSGDKGQLVKIFRVAEVSDD